MTDDRQGPHENRAPLEPGRTLGPYTLGELIGAGGMGEVYRAKDQRLGRDVAVKVLPARLSADPERRLRFEREARAASALNHPNICTVYDVGTDGDVPFLVLELLKGHSLKERLAKGPLPLGELLELAIPIADALEVAHEAGIIHRDLKPANIFITDRGVPKLLDFGLAKVAMRPSGDDDTTQAMSHLTGVHAVLGTLPYMSPEQLRGQPLDRRTDLFSFGAVLYEMATGVSPFGGETSGVIVENVLMRAPAQARLADAGVPAALEAIISKALEKDRELRYQAARDLRVDLRRLKASSTQPTAAVVEASEPRAVRRRRMQPLVVAAGVALAVLAAALIGPPIWRRLGPSSADGVAGMAPPRVSPFLATDALERMPAWNPTANLVAYVSDASGNDDIWICDASGTSATNLTASFDGVDASPAWSPDGTHIVFYSERDGPGIYTMTALGAGVRQLVSLHAPLNTRLNVNAASLQWADDDRIVYDDVDPTGRRQVYSTALDGSPPACLTCGLTAYQGVRAGRLSPNGELLAFLSRGTPSPLYLLDQRSRRVTSLADAVENPRWAASDRLLFSSRIDGIEDLWEVQIDQATGMARRAPVRVTSGLHVREFSVADAGRRILATRDTSSSHLWTVPTAASHLTDLSQAHRLTSGAAMDSQGRWAADGSVVFTSDRRGGFDIWRLASGADSPLRLTSTGNAERPRISPGGRWITFNNYGGSPGRQFVMRPDGGDVHVIDDAWATQYAAVCCAEWSPDGTRIALSMSPTALRQDQPVIVEVDPATGRARSGPVQRLSGLPPRAGFGRWSPDGRRLVYEANSDGGFSLWVVLSNGQDARQITNLPGNNRGPAWQAKPLAIYFRHDFTSIWRLPMTPEGMPAGPPEPWFELSARSRQSFDHDSFDVSASGDQLLVTVIQQDTDVWLVERTTVPGTPVRRP